MMKNYLKHTLLAAACIVCLTACSPAAEKTEPSVAANPSTGTSSLFSSPVQSGSPSSGDASSQPLQASAAPEPATGNITGEQALDLAMENAGVSADDAYNIKVEKDGDNGIPIYDIEFETHYGDYNFEVAIEDGRIVGADYEVDEEWIRRLGEKSISAEQAKDLIQSKIPGVPRDEIRIWEERGDGRIRFEGEVYHQNIKYEFEIDAQTGVIFDWNADLRI